jgi:membrane protease YdiL (CAAX protease family)
MKKKTDKELDPATHKMGMYGPFAAIAVVLLAYFGSQIIGGVAIGLFAKTLGYDEANIQQLFDNSVLWQFSFLLLVEAVTFAIIWWFISARKIPLKHIGLGRRPVVKDMSYALAAFGIYFVLLIVVVAIVSTVFPIINLDQKQQLNFESAKGGWSLVLVFVGLVLLPAFVEEVLVRGFLYSGLRKTMPYLTAAISASLLFGVAHLQLGSGAPPLWVAAIDTFVLSMVLIELRERTKALWSGMFVHGLKNALAFISLFIFMH